MILGIDIGGSKVALGVAGHDGRLLATRRRGAPGPDFAAELAAIAEDARGLLGDDTPEAIGIAAPGPLDRERGLLLGPPNLPGWSEAPVVAALADAFGVPAFLENDANAAALAEWRFGAGRGAERLVYLTMSTGVGAGLVLDGRLYRGRRDLAGEVGHAPVEWEGEPCECGLHGCLEAYVGGRAWTRWLREHAPGESAVARIAGSRQAIAPEHALAGAVQGDPFAREALARFADFLARGLVGAAFAYAPDVIVLGTIVAAAGDALLATLRTQVEAHVWPQLAEGLRIEASALWPEGAALAGVCAALEGLADTARP